MNKLIVLAGPSGVGKSRLLSKLADAGLCDLAPKYTERRERTREEDVVHVDDVSDAAYSCDIIYDMYGTRYGISTAGILRGLRLKNQAIIVSDIDALKKTRAILGERMIGIYISPADDSVEKLIEAYISRAELIISREEKETLDSIARELQRWPDASEAREFSRTNDLFRARVEEHFAEDSDFYGFMSRYESLAKARDFFEENADLFDRSLDGNVDSFEELEALLRKCMTE